MEEREWVVGQRRSKNWKIWVRETLASHHLRHAPFRLRRIRNAVATIIKCKLSAYFDRAEKFAASRSG
jgi:hypothetical protein